MTKKTHEIWNFRFVNQIIDSMADGVFTMDAGGRISSWNPSMERISGYSAEEVLGRTCEILQCSRCFGKKCPAGIKKCGIIKLGISEAKECFLKHKEGHNVSIIKNASVVRDENENIIGVVETVTDMTELSKARRKIEEAALRLGEMHRLDNIIGKSRAMREVFTAIKAAAASDVTVLVHGDSGTGKELVAGAIHYNSERAAGPLITVNCSALSESLLESELFGHVKGAYTGALHDRAGRFEEAEGGTVFLDEIGELSPYIQVKLLRVLQEREIERVGESKRRKINIRIIAATHRNLYDLVREGAFRDDLYYRLKVFPIQLPLLDQRRDDIPLLVGHFIQKHNKKTAKQILGVSQATLRIFMDYSWPGNVRELENAIEHAFVVCNREQIEPYDLPVELRQARYRQIDKEEEKNRSVSRPYRRVKIDKKELLEILNESDWNKAEAARRIGISRTAVWKYMKKWAIPLSKTH
ncbi:MAG: sigma 54-interacting transcriptional regulator [Desulfobacterales bacterium]|jgi:PAS domain S-box-containing protein